MSAVLAVDLGGSSLKAGLFDIGGTRIASASVPLGFEEDGSGRSEQAPERWWEALAAASEAIATEAGPRFQEVAAVAICGFTRSQVLVDAQGNAVRSAIGFRDSRAAGVIDEVLARREITAHPHARHLNAFHPLARLLWLKRHEPKAFAATRLVLDPKDYLNLRLTGQARSDAISQFWLIEATSGDPSLATLAGLARTPRAPVGAPEGIVGRVREGLPGALAGLAGARVLTGSHDTFSAAAGLGALRPDIAYCISGSSEVFGLLGEEASEAQGLITMRWGPGLWQIGGPGLNGANTLNWIVDRVNSRDLPLHERLDGLLAAPTSESPLLFLPFLNGERTPYWDCDLRAAFIGLSASHSASDMVRAVMAGIAYVNRAVLTRAEAASGRPASEVRMAGGGARSPIWNQIRADVLGRPLLASHESDMGLLGCIALARVGLGIDPDLKAAADALPREFACFAPDPAAAQRHDALFAVYESAVTGIADASHRLAELARAPKA